MTDCLHTSEIVEKKLSLKAGDRVLLSGLVYTARDAAHKRLIHRLEQEMPLPFEIREAVLYYAGPTPAREGMPIGSCGPTTSSRMDMYTPALLDRGLSAMIGKGERSQVVVDSIIKNNAVYFSAVGGAGALIARCVKKSEEIAFSDLGCESIKRLEVEKLPLIVAIDACGRSIFKIGREQYENFPMSQAESSNR